jgi:predicted RNase H-like HicB family nuclease
MPSYIGLIRKDKDSDFGVGFPDFPGCISAGHSIDEARRMAQEALELHVGGMIEDGEALPEPTSLEAVMADPDNSEAVAFLATVPEPAERSVRVNITLPVRLLRRIAARAANRSAFLARGPPRRRLPRTDPTGPPPASAGGAGRGRGSRRLAWLRTRPGGR